MFKREINYAVIRHKDAFLQKIYMATKQKLLVVNMFHLKLTFFLDVCDCGLDYNVLNKLMKGLIKSTQPKSVIQRNDVLFLFLEQVDQCLHFFSPELEQYRPLKKASQ